MQLANFLFLLARLASASAALESAAPKRSLVPDLGEILANRGADAAGAQYHELKRTNANGYNFDERALNRLGHMLLADEVLFEGVETVDAASMGDHGLSTSGLIGRDDANVPTVSIIFQIRCEELLKLHYASTADGVGQQNFGD